MKKKEPKIIEGVVHWRCSKCKKWVPADHFSKNSRAPNKLQNRCKTCNSNYYTDNKKRISERSQQYYIDNREAIIGRSCKYAADNKEKHNENGRR